MNVEEKAVTVRPKVNEVLIGIAEDKAAQLRNAFIPMLDVLDGHEKDYNEILELEINEETCQRAKRLRLDIAKIRTGAAKVKKDQKAEYLRAGRAVDGLFHIIEYAVVSKEDKLKEIETYHERIETDRKNALAIERVEELKKYDCDGENLGLGEMNETVWSNFLMGTKTNYETVKAAEIKAETDRLETVRKTKLNNDRKMQCSRLIDFIPDFVARDLSDLSIDEYKTLTTETVRLRTAKEKEQEEIRLENVKLKEEADKKESDQKSKDEKIRLENQKKLDEEKKIADDKLEKERKEKAKIQKKLDDEKDLQKKIKLAEDKRIKDAELAPDKEKLRKILIQFDGMRGKLSSEIANTAMDAAYVVIEKAVKALDVDWLSIKCPGCGKEGNYLPTISGTSPCGNPRCHKLINVGKING